MGIKVSDLNKLPKASLDKSEDYILINDYSANETKTIIVDDLLADIVGGGGSGTELPTTGSNLDYLIYANKRIQITLATKISTYVLELTLEENHNLTTGDSVFINYDNRIKGFSYEAYGTFVATVISAKLIRITTTTSIGSGAFTTAGKLELVNKKDYVYYYDGDKSVEVVYGNGKRKSSTSIQSAIYEAYDSQGTVVVHKSSTPYVEAIILKNGVDIHLENGVILTNNTSYPVIQDGGLVVVSKISGNGIIKHTGSNNIDTIRINNSSSELTLECDSIYHKGVFPGSAGCIYSNGKRLTVKCNRLISEQGSGIILNNTSQYFNFNIGTIETGVVGQNNTGSTALWTNGEGYIRVNKIVCNNGGHTFSHHSGKCVAHIDRMYTTNNNDGAGGLPIYSTSPVSILAHQSNDSVDITLYFEEIGCYNGVQPAQPGVVHERGTLNLIGRKIFAENDSGVTYQKGTAGTALGFIKVDQIHSNNWFGLNINTNHNTPIIVESTKITTDSGGGNYGALNMGSYPSAVSLKNCTIKNNTDSANTPAISLSGTQNITMSNCELECVNSSSNSIYSSVGNNVKVKLPVWQDQNEHANVHYITNGGILIQ